MQAQEQWRDALRSKATNMTMKEALCHILPVQWNEHYIAVALIPRAPRLYQLLTSLVRTEQNLSKESKAFARAQHNLHCFERFDGHTIFHEENSNYGLTKIYWWPAQSGTGMRASHTIRDIIHLVGFSNVKLNKQG